jgi:carotenoid cleavage dioxygenase-like enzyme
MGDHRVGLRPFEGRVTDHECPVAGEIPDWLDGRLFRNGPGRYSAGDREVNHWFDGFALLRAFDVGDGAVTYSARLLDSEAYRHVRDHGELGYMEFGTNPDQGILRRLYQVARGGFTDNASVTVTRIGGEFTAVTETPRSVRFDPDTLAARETHTFDDDLSAVWSLAHRHYDFDREAAVGLAVDIGRRSHYRVYRRPKGGTRREELGSVAVDRPSYMHSFAVTTDHVVLTEHPFDTHPLRLATGKPFVENFRWRPDAGTRFLVLDRGSGDLVAEHTVDPFFTFHHANAFVDDGVVVVDLVAFDDASVVDRLYLDELRRPDATPPGGELRRYRLPLAGGRPESEPLHSGPLEFPMIDYQQRVGRQHRYVWGAGSEADRPRGFLDCVRKVDARAGEVTVTWTEPDTFPGEPVFVGRPGRGAEDDGVLLSVALDAVAEQSMLLILDAADLSELARAPLPGVLPMGFHGQFFTGDGVPTPSMG